MTTSRPTPEYGAPWLPITSTGRAVRVRELELTAAQDQLELELVDDQEEKVPEVYGR